MLYVHEVKKFSFEHTTYLGRLVSFIPSTNAGGPITYIGRYTRWGEQGESEVGSHKLGVVELGGGEAISAPSQ